MGPTTHWALDPRPDRGRPAQARLREALKRWEAPPLPLMHFTVDLYTDRRCPCADLHRRTSNGRNAKTKFELLEVRPVSYVPTECRPYIHINFIARATEQGSQGLLFFAELYLCGKRRSPSGYSVTYCEPLGDNSITGRNGMDRPRADPSATTEKIDLTYCYACDQNMLHPEGVKYVGGHCNVPGIYKGCAML
uniref:DUF3615 domain-containing protein n=1 Tax=Aegilops tauschii TaxID=37682 RepID=M8CYF5_AEGTA